LKLIKQLTSGKRRYQPRSFPLTYGLEILCISSRCRDTRSCKASPRCVQRFTSYPANRDTTKHYLPRGQKNINRTHSTWSYTGARELFLLGVKIMRATFRGVHKSVIN